ncbi:signal peptide protein [Legionella erythra]|uniref:Signal peptide protein n=2 Tax=Legionella erythra TaxID=448 RepID=A0A0W0TRY8_LEGER|nr:signal peptide protein [Legionella erythra]
MNKEKIICTAMGAFLAAAVNQLALAESGAVESEKCYGIVKAGMNDCATAKASCAGSATEDKQADAFILLPAGVCERIVGGQLTPPAKPNSAQ